MPSLPSRKRPNKFAILLTEAEGGSVRGKATYNGEPVTKEMFTNPPNRLFRAGIQAMFHITERWGIPISIDRQEDANNDN